MFWSLAREVANEIETSALKFYSILDLASDLWPIVSPFDIFPHSYDGYTVSKGPSHVIKNLCDEQCVYIEGHWRIQTLSAQDVNMSFILIDVLKIQCLDSMKVNELAGWLYFSFIQQLLWPHKMVSKCSTYIINNGMKSKGTTER